MFIMKFSTNYLTVVMSNLYVSATEIWQAITYSAPGESDPDFIHVPSI